MNAPVRQNGNGTATNVASIIGGRAPMPRSEATQIEQSRAVAEVQAMVIVAQSRRRDVSRALQDMEQSCGRMALAERAFFSFKRGGSTVNGPSIQLARELARCWGNVNHGVRELDRGIGQSEMLAFGWDLETNLRADVSFIVPHMRDKTGGPVPLTDMRDIYENNANNAARRLREMIFACLPVWFREEGIALCRRTLEKGESGEPLPIRISKMLGAYSEIGVSRERVEARFGGSVDTMTVVDLANYGILFRSIKQGEASKDEEFPPLTASQVSQIINPSAPPPTSNPDGGAKGGQTVVDPPAAAAGSDCKPEATGQPAQTVDQQEKAKKDWSIPAGVVGQEKKLAAIYAMLDGAAEPKCETAEEVDELWEFHEGFLDKLGTKKAEANHRFGDRKIGLAQADTKEPS